MSASVLRDSAEMDSIVLVSAANILLLQKVNINDTFNILRFMLHQLLFLQRTTSATTPHTCVLTTPHVSTQLVLMSASVSMDSLEMGSIALVS